MLFSFTDKIFMDKIMKKLTRTILLIIDINPTSIAPIFTNLITWFIIADQFYFSILWQILIFLLKQFMKRARFLIHICVYYAFRSIRLFYNYRSRN